MIQRNLYPQVKHWLNRDKILIIKGPRQVGKTTLLQIIKKDLEAEKKQTIYFSIDQELHNPIFTDHKLFFIYLNDQFELNSKNKLYVFLDEFQYIKEAGLFLKVLFDQYKDKLQFIVSGSSSLEITRNSEFLTGRKIEFNMTPLSFFEYVSYKSSNQYKRSYSLNDFQSLSDFNQIYQEDLKKHFVDYLNYGGYPEVVLLNNTSDKKRVIREIITTYIQKDITAFLHVENPQAFNKLIVFLASQIGNLVNQSSLRLDLGINTETVQRYLSILEGTYLFDFVKPYFTNVRKELSKMPKAFINDFGALNYVLGFSPLFDFDIIGGEKVENFIYNELKLLVEKENINFYRTVSKAEIDFIVKTGNNFTPIEVKFRNSVNNLPIVMQNFSGKYNSKKQVVFTKNTIKQENNTYFLPAYLISFLKEL